MQSYAWIAEAHNTVAQTRRAQRLDTDSARRMQSDAHNATKARCCAEFKTTRDTTNADAQKPQGSYFVSAQIMQI